MLLDRQCCHSIKSCLPVVYYVVFCVVANYYEYSNKFALHRSGTRSVMQPASVMGLSSLSLSSPVLSLVSGQTVRLHAVIDNY